MMPKNRIFFVFIKVLIQEQISDVHLHIIYLYTLFGIQTSNTEDSLNALILFESQFTLFVTELSKNSYRSY